jgi:trehalose utilization protein
MINYVYSLLYAITDMINYMCSLLSAKKLEVPELAELVMVGFFDGGTIL